MTNWSRVFPTSLVCQICWPLFRNICVLGVCVTKHRCTLNHKAFIQKDTAEDPVDRAVNQCFGLLCWGSPADSQGKNCGNYCFYCVMVHASRYRHRGYTLKSLMTACGGDHDLSETVQSDTPRSPNPEIRRSV